MEMEKVALSLRIIPVSCLSSKIRSCMNGFWGCPTHKIESFLLDLFGLEAQESP